MPQDRFPRHVGILKDSNIFGRTGSGRISERPNSAKFQRIPLRIDQKRNFNLNGRIDPENVQDLKKIQSIPPPPEKKFPKNSPISNGRKDRKNLKDLKGSQRISKDLKGSPWETEPKENPPHKKSTVQKKLNNEQHSPQRMTRATRIVRIIRIS